MTTTFFQNISFFCIFLHVLIIKLSLENDNCFPFIASEVSIERERELILWAALERFY